MISAAGALAGGFVRLSRTSAGEGAGGAERFSGPTFDPYNIAACDVRLRFTTTTPLTGHAFIGIICCCITFQPQMTRYPVGSQSCWF